MITTKSIHICDLIFRFALISIIIVALGYLDFITGEISLDILYMLCIIVATWFTNTYIGLICVVEVIFVKVAADYYDNIRVGSHLYEWNTINYIVFYLVTCLLIGKLKSLLTK
jgi:magnesium-transporting ATPase (P-type)